MENNTKKMKKYRCQNWLDDEKTLLLNLVQRYVRDIENKNTDTSTNTKKRETWQKICDSFNELAHRQGSPRTVRQLKTQWSIIKMKMKKILTQERKSTMKASGRRNPVGSADDSIMSWLPNKFEIDTNSSDSESKVIAIPDNSNSDEEITSQHEEQNNADDDVIKIEGEHEHTQQTTVRVRTSPENVIINDEGQEATIPRNKLLKEQKEATAEQEAGHLMKTVVNFDKKIKSKLHEMQMKNEHLKHEILLLKLEYWRKKVATVGGHNPELDNNISSD